MRLAAELSDATVRSSLARRSSGCGARGGFTLIEVLLAIAIFSLLAAVVTINMFGGVKEKYLDEGSRQFETVLRMARAEAANQGRRMRLAWSAGEERIMVMWEPQPLAQPGQFVEHTGASWVRSMPNDMVRVVGGKRDGAADEDALVFADKPSGMDKDETQQTLIDFYPDGSCDTATFELASRDEGDLRRAVVEMDGLNYLISTRILTPTELAQWYEQNVAETSGSSDY